MLGAPPGGVFGGVNVLWVEQVPGGGHVGGPVVDGPVHPPRGPVQRPGDAVGRGRRRGLARGVGALDAERHHRFPVPVVQVLADEQHPGPGGGPQVVPGPVAGADGQLEGAVAVHGQVAQGHLCVHVVLVEVHVALDQGEQGLVRAVDPTPQHVGGVGVDGAALVHVVRVGCAPLRPRQFVAVQARVEGVRVLELTLQRQAGLPGQVADPLGPAPVVGGEVVLGEAGRQPLQGGGPAGPGLAGGISP